ncbi:glycosyltransferase family 4 protein [bacterium]|nr:glycosyltransferase family 4 protein [bacterium]
MARVVHVCFVSLQARGAFVQTPGQRIGGAENQVKHLATWLAAHGFRASVIVENAGQPEVETIDGVELHRLSQPPCNNPLGRLKRRLFSGLELGRIVRRLGADVYVQRTAGVETGLVQRAAAAIGKRFIYIASSDSETGPFWRNGWTATPLMFRRGLRRADRVIAQHDAQRAAFEKTYGVGAIVLPDVYPFPEVEISTGDRVVWVGRCAAVKQPRLALELARRIPGARFAMVTAATKHEAGLLPEIQREAAAVPNLEFIPGLPWPRLQDVYRSGAILVNTSLYEGIPNTFFEAAAHGLAIATLGVDPDGMLTREGAGVCAGGDFERLVALVRDLLNDPASRRQLADKAQTLLRDRHDIDRVGARFAELIREMI